MIHDTDRDGCPIRGATVVAIIIAAMLIGWIAERGMPVAPMLRGVTQSITHAVASTIATVQAHSVRP